MKVKTKGIFYSSSILLACLESNASHYGLHRLPLGCCRACRQHIHILNHMHFGMTLPTQISRGTIQDNTCSPIMFFISLEPILIWLEKDMTPTTMSTLHIPCNTTKYINDLAIISNDIENLQTQTLVDQDQNKANMLTFMSSKEHRCSIFYFFSSLDYLIKAS